MVYKQYSNAKGEAKVSLALNRGFTVRFAERVAVKMIDKTKLDAKTQKMLMREINIMDSLSHPSLVR